MCVAASDMNYFYNVIVSEDERRRVELLEPFDEFEEWHLKCAHYVLLTAFSGSCLHLASILWPCISEAKSDIVNSEVSDCGIFECMNKHSCHLPSSSNFEPLNAQNNCRVKEPAFIGDNTTISCDVEQNRSSNLQEDTAPSLCSNTVCMHGLHWSRAEFTFIGEEADTRCQRFGHTLNTLLINGRHCMAVVGGFGVVSSGRHCRLSDISVWNLSLMSAETYTVDNDHLLSRMCHATVTLGDSALLGNPLAGNSRLVVVGGRRSPTSTVSEHVILVNFSNTNAVTCHAVSCSGDVPAPCWRHTVIRTLINSQLILLNK